MKASAETGATPPLRRRSRDVACVLLFLVWLPACASRSHETKDEALEIGTPEERALRFAFVSPHTEGLTPLRLWATYHNSPIVSARPKGVPLLDRKGRPLGPRLGLADWCRAAMQGTTLVRQSDGTLATYNFATVVDERQVDCTARYPRHGRIGGTRFQRSKGRYGNGALGWPLVPYRTLAVDPKRLPLGSVIYIPKARGVRIVLPDGQALVHDGYFLAGNQGGSVDGSQIDVFIGPALSNPFEFVTSHRAQRFEAYVVADDEVQRGLRAQHGL